MPEILAAATNGDIANNNINGEVGGKADMVNNNKGVNGGSANGSANGSGSGGANGVHHTADKPGGYLAGGSEWIDAALVAEAVGEDPACIRDLVVKAAVAAGDNYCSCMWRVRAVAGDRPVALIVKAPPRGELMQEFVTKFDFFTKEARMLTETLPAMRAIAAERCGPDHILSQQLGPVALPCSAPGVLIMNDLSVDGFRNKERQDQLDRVHCEVALEMLARFHALSLALYRQAPASMDAYAEAVYTRREDPEDEVAGKQHTEGQLKKFGELAETWEGTKGKGLGEKIVKLSDGMFGRICDLVASSDESTGAINVLNHGDFWINNMMYLYDEDDAGCLRPTDIRVVDLQIVRFSSPALDLQYFITTSANQQVRDELLDELLQHYRHHFNEYVTALGLEDARWPSLAALREEFFSKALFGFLATYTVLCAVVAIPEDKLQLDSATKENIMEQDISAKAWRGSNFQRILPGVLDYFSRAGVFV